MAVNPLATDDLTVNFNELMEIPISKRVQAAESSSAFVDAILKAMTPFQVAQAFPTYYQKELPDITNFITTNIERKLGAAGRSYDQRGGGTGGTARPSYSGEGKLPSTARPQGTQKPSLAEMKKKLLEKGIDIDGVYSAVGTSGIPLDDAKVSRFRGIPDKELAKMGFEKFKSADGKDMIRQKAYDVERMTDEQISAQISGKIVAKETATQTQKDVLDFANRWGISPEAAAGVFKVESGVTNGATNGGYHGVFQLETEQVPQFTEAAGFGKLSAAQFRELPVADQLKVMDEYYKFHKVKPGFFTGDPKTDTAKMWALQLAPSNAKKLDYTDPNARIAKPGQAGLISAGGRGGPVTVGSSMNSLAGGVEYLSDAITRIEGTATPEQIKEFKREEKAQEDILRKTRAAEYAYNLSSPSTSEAIPGEGQTVLGDPTEQFGFTRGATAGVTDVDQRLVDIQKEAAKTFPLRIRLFSGGQISGRGTGAHAQGLATDTIIYDENGVPISSHQTPGTMNIYALWAEHQKRVQERMYPELSGEMTWGGAWQGMLKGGGAGINPRTGERATSPADAMDMRIGGYSEQSTMQAYKFGQGWQQGYEHYVENDFLGVGTDLNYERDLSKLVGFKMTPEQIQYQYDLANQFNLSSGLLNHRNIGERQVPMMAAGEDTPEVQQTATPQRTMVMSMGTNDWYDTKDTYNNSLAAIKAAQAKGYKVVVIPPRTGSVEGKDFTAASAEVRRAAADAGVDLEEVQDWSGTGGYHPPNKEAKRIAAKYPGQTFVGDSIANQIGTFSEGGTKIATDGVNTSKILENVNSDQVAAQAITPEPTAQPQAMALGGFIPEKDNLSVTNDQGDVVAKINEGELQNGLTREGSGMRVESNKKRMAESLVDQNERSMYASDISEPAQETEQTNAGGFRQVQKPARITNDVMPKDQQWREAAASASYPIGSQIRAFKRSKFMQEGYHFNRATPGSQT
jgi:hypothetical protein